MMYFFESKQKPFIYKELSCVTFYRRAHNMHLLEWILKFYKELTQCV